MLDIIDEAAKTISLK